MRTSKIVALVATAALLVVASAFSVFAATVATGGTWDNSEGVWKYKTKSGEYLTQGWAKSGSDNFYLDENGEMAVSQLIDDGDAKYFVDENGAMVKNKWEKIANTEEDGDEYYWYYFKASGAAQTIRNNKPVTIGDKKYMFNDDGHMLYGWINETSEIQDNDGKEFMTGMYYAGGQDDGAIRTSKWEKIAVIDTRDPSADSEEQEYWFYFQASGIKVYSKDANNALEDDKLFEKSINGKKYAFDECGVMKAEWAETSTISSAATIGDYAWYRLVTDTETGAKLKKGWFRTVPQAKVSTAANADEEKHWFYAKGDGTIAKSEVRTIDGKKYGFDNEGKMLAGLYCLKVSDGAIDAGTDWDAACIDTASEVTTAQKTVAPANYAYYFFGDEETDGSAKTGLVTTNIDGDDYKILLGSTGSVKFTGIQKIKGSCYYINGFKLAADADMKYWPAVWASAPAYFGLKDCKLSSVNDQSAQTLSLPTTKPNATTIKGGTYSLVSSNGTIVKSGKFTDADGRKYTVTYYKITDVE